jgi:hypothetical protein
MKKTLTVIAAICSSAFACQDEIVAKGIVATGYSAITVKPDMTVVYLSIKGKGKTLDKAKNDAKNKFNELKTTIGETKISKISLEKIGEKSGSDDMTRFMGGQPEMPQAIYSYQIKLSFSNSEANESLISTKLLETEAEYMESSNFGEAFPSGFIYTTTLPETKRDSLLVLAANDAKRDAEKKAKIFGKEISELDLIYRSCTNEGITECSFPGNSFRNFSDAFDEKLYSKDPNVLEIKAMAEVRYSFKQLEGKK